MIRIQRALPEPTILATTRATQLAKLHALARHPTAKEIAGYRVVAADLLAMQHNKCCYCERHIPKNLNDVEHYRPKTQAKRQPGCLDEHGYWWLAFTWDNLLYACPNCNQLHKKVWFPLDEGSIPLAVGEIPPGQELPLLLNPAGAINPIEHIQFVLEQEPDASPKWRAKPRNGSRLGEWTIKVCGLDAPDTIDMHTAHVESHILPMVKIFEDYWRQKNALKLWYESALPFFTAKRPFAALNYDAMRHFIPDDKLYAAIKRHWPGPDQIGC